MDSTQLLKLQENSMKKVIREIPYIYGDNPKLLLERLAV